jgi:hypothetical protein
MNMAVRIAATLPPKNDRNKASAHRDFFSGAGPAKGRRP